MPAGLIRNWLARANAEALKTRSKKTDTSQTTVRFEEPGNFLQNLISSLVPPRNTGFYTFYTLYILFTYF